MAVNRLFWLFLALFLNVSADASFFTFGKLKEAICKPGGAYNIEALKQPKSWLLNDTVREQCLDGAAETCNFVFTFCQAVNCSKDLVNATACLETNNTTYKLGSFDANVNPFGKFMGDNFVVHFKNGSPYSPDQKKSCNLSMDMHFNCDQNGKWPNQFGNRVPVNKASLQGIDFHAGTCKYQLEFAYDGACLLPTPTFPTAALSAGSVLLIMFFVCITLYCIIGGVYNYFNGGRGREIIPQSEFWFGLPGYIAEGCRFTYRCCKDDRYNTRYESI